MMIKKKIVIVGTRNYRINMDDFWMFFHRSNHDVIKVLYHENISQASWFRENRAGNPSKSRAYQFDPLDLRVCTKFSSDVDLIKKIRDLDPDYICAGNGSDATGKTLLKVFGNKMLFSEYGWLPWSEHFYISRNGTGYNSEIATVRANDLKNVPINYEGIDYVKQNLNRGADVAHENFIYVPLQVDRGDFKFNFTSFKNNLEFVKFVCGIVPERYPILVKHHPLNKNRCNLRGLRRVIDISDKDYNKFQILSNMKAMMCINSTSVMEGLMFDKRLFTYGYDLFSNKGLIYENIKDKKTFENKIVEPREPQSLNLSFISFLLSRQVHRKRCCSNDTAYVKSHYWNKNI